MGRLTLLLPLLCAATFCVNAHPYSKIPGGAQYRDGFNTKRSSSSSQSSNFNQANQDNISINGVQNGRPFVGSKSSAYSQNGGSHSQSSSYSSTTIGGAIPIGLASNVATTGSSQLGYGGLHKSGASFVNQGSSDGSAVDEVNAEGQQGGSRTAGSQYWWMGSNSPFLDIARPSGDCTSNGCLASATYNSKAYAVAGGGYASNGIKQQGNPFLQGAGFTHGGSSVGGSSGSSNSIHGASIDASKNPFLNGAGFNAASSSNGYGNAGSSGETQTNLVGGGNAFLNSAGSSGSGFGQAPEISQVSQGQENIYQDQQVGGFPSYPGFPIADQPKEQESNDGGLKVSCTGDGHICVPYYLCSADGYVTNKGLTQVRSGPQVCNLNNEVCCILKSSDQAPADSTSDGSFGNGNHQQPDFVTGEAGNQGGFSGISNDRSENNGYLPPIGSEPSSNVPAILHPPIDDEPDESGGSNSPVSTSIFPAAVAPPPQVGCAAALICVEDQFCSLQGVIVTEPLSFSSEQLVRRVPLSSCKNPDNGVIGKCCRDPNYVDPWPAGNLPANYSGGFDEQGFPTFLNIAKTRLAMKQPPTTVGATEGGRPTVKTPFSGVNNFPTPVKTPIAGVNNFPTPVKTPFAGVNNFPTPVKTPIAGVNNFPTPVKTPFAGVNNFPTPVKTPIAGVNNFPTPVKTPIAGVNNFPTPVKTPIAGVNNFPTPVKTPFAGVNNFPTPVKTPIAGVNNFPTPVKTPIAGVNNFPTPVKTPIAGVNNFPTPVKTPISGVNNFPTPVKTPIAGVNNFPTPVKTPIAGVSNFPTPVKTPITGVNNFPKPAQVPQVPFGGAVNSPTPFIAPNSQNPFLRNNYDGATSIQNPAIIAPHVAGSHCGLRNKVQRPNGLSDVDVAFGEIPWQAMVLSSTDRKLLCSGAIIAPNAVVTAARCVEGFNPSEVAIKTGEWKLGYELKHEEPLPFEIINVASIAPYPSFSPGNPANDIAILFLEHEMKLDQHVDTLCLPEGQPKPPQPGRKCIATGWGKTILQVNVAGSLMHSIDVDVLGNEQCLQRISGAETPIPLDDSLICGKAHKQSNNMCQVDFGGPLACDRGDGYYELAGIYNQDTGCLPTNQVATFATIPTRWVQEMMAKPPQYSTGVHQSPVSVGQNQFVHTHGSNQPCNCYEHELLPAGSSQYLPPQ